MQGPDPYEIDDHLMDELDGTMDDFDAKKMKPLVTITVAVAEGDDKGEEDDKKPDGEEPTPEELEELQKALG